MGFCGKEPKNHMNHVFFFFVLLFLIFFKNPLALLNPQGHNKPIKKRSYPKQFKRSTTLIGFVVFESTRNLYVCGGPILYFIPTGDTRWILTIYEGNKVPHSQRVHGAKDHFIRFFFSSLTIYESYSTLISTRHHGKYFQYQKIRKEN